MIDLGNIPTGTPPSNAEQAQLRNVIGVPNIIEQSYSKFRAGKDSIVTVDPATDVFTCVGHEFTDTQKVWVSATTTMPSPLVVGTAYFCRDISANTFKLAATSGGAAINITTAGVGVVNVQQNYMGSANANSMVIGHGNFLNSSYAGYAYGRGTLVAGLNNITANLGPTYFLGSTNTVTGAGGFGVAAAIGSGNTIFPTSGGIALALGDIMSIKGNCNVGIGYHNYIENDPQGCLAVGAGCYGYWQGTIHQVSHATAGDIGQAIGTLRNTTGNHPGGDAYVPITTSYATSARHMWLKPRKFYNIIIDGGVGTSAYLSSDFMSFIRRVVVRQEVYTVGSGRASDIVSISGNTITSTAHGFSNGNVVYITASNTVPSPLVSGVGYYVVSATTDTLQLALTNGGAAITLTDTGAGTMTLSANVPPKIYANEALASDVGSNAGALPSGWAYRIVPYNMVITAAMGHKMPDGTTYAGSVPTSLPQIRLYVTLPANSTGYMCAARFTTIEGFAF